MYRYLTALKYYEQIIQIYVQIIYYHDFQDESHDIFSISRLSSEYHDFQVKSRDIFLLSRLFLYNGYHSIFVVFGLYQNRQLTHHYPPAPKNNPPLPTTTQK